MSNVKELNINNTTYDIIGKGVVDQNSATPLKEWSGTKAQYDAIATKDADTIYNITDDTNPNDYAHTNLDNVSAGIDFVIASQLPTSSNNYTWYRLYKSGWVEQGGQLLNTSGSNGTVTFLVEMKDTSYYATIQAYNSGSYPLLITTFTTTSFSYTGNVGKNWWQVKGMSAQGGS